MGGDNSQIARLLLLIRFYFELPRQANNERPIPFALRMAQVCALLSRIIVFDLERHGLEVLLCQKSCPSSRSAP